MLTVEQLTVQYDDRTVVNNVSFELPKGTITGMAGGSGSGKTTLALALAGLLPPRATVSGQMTLDNITYDMAQPSAFDYLRGRVIGMVFQEPFSSLNPLMRCGEQLTETLAAHKKMDQAAAKTAALEWLRRVQITDAERAYAAYPHELSGGQLQRVMIAMALCCGPQLLLADEPTTALDTTVQKSILDLLRELQAELGLTVLLVSHDLKVLRHLCTRAGVMYRGNLVSMDNIDQVILPQPALDEALSRPPLKTPLDPPILFKHPGVTVDYPLQKGFWGKPKAWLTAVDQVPVSIRRGECLAVVGESGSGKSTLGRAIADLMGNAKGKAVYIDQHPDAALNPSMTVGAALSEVVRHFTPNLSPAEAKAQALELLQSVGLEAAHYDRLPQALSGGQKQRVCIARALSAAPTLLICDEILSGLDTDNQTAVLQLLSQLRTTHDLTLLFITHDLSVVATFADRVMVLYKGKLEEQGPVKQVFARPKSAYTQLLLGARL